MWSRKVVQGLDAMLLLWQSNAKRKHRQERAAYDLPHSAGFVRDGCPQVLLL